MDEIKNWKKWHRFQEKPGWCGPAVIQMMLLSCGINKTQSQISRYVYKKWWGTGQSLILAYLSRYFGIVGLKQNSRISDIEKALRQNYRIILDWWDGFEKEDEGGHYSLAIGYDKKRDILTLADPSNQRKGIWEITGEEFEKKWYDFLDIDNRIKSRGWMVWVEPGSRKFYGK